MGVEVEINPVFMQALRHVAAQHDIRYYLCGVCIEFGDDATYYVATNGHALAVIREHKAIPSEELRGRKIIVPKRFLDHMLKPPSSAEASLILDAGERALEVRLKVAGFDDSIFFAIDGTFPEWRKTMPKVDIASGQEAKFNSDYIRQITAAYQEAFCGNLLTLIPNGNGTSYLVGRDPRFYGAVMPLLNSHMLPDWVRPPQPVST